MLRPKVTETPRTESPSKIASDALKGNKLRKSYIKTLRYEYLLAAREQ